MARPQGLEVNYDDIKTQIQQQCDRLSFRTYGLKKFVKRVGMTYRQRHYFKTTGRISKMNLARLHVYGKIAIPMNILFDDIRQEIFELSNKDNKNDLQGESTKTGSE